MLSRDGTYDGIFWFGVRSTGIFCRPTCPARKPGLENVDYYASIRDAVSAGFKPCKRCRPLDPPGTVPAWVAELCERIEREPRMRITDADLRAMALEPSRVRRYFQRHYGLTFQAYHRARRMGMALAQLQHGQDSLAVGFDHGFDSTSGFRDAFARTIGTTPGQARSIEKVVTTYVQTPLGPMLAGANDQGVVLLEFCDRRAIEKQLSVLQRRLRCVIVPGEHRLLDQLRDELDTYFAGSRSRFEVPLVVSGTPFQEQVWRALLEIPYGTTISYKKLAACIGRPGAQRAVGRANGDNRLAILIPCHRVINKDGTLRGYGGGLWRKQFLLDIEQGNRRET